MEGQCRVSRSTIYCSVSWFGRRAQGPLLYRYRYPGMTLYVCRGRTEGGEVYQAREGDDPAVLAVHNVATIELEGRSEFDTRTTDLATRLTKRPSASHLFRRNGTRLITPETMNTRYPDGPGGNTPSTPGNSRLSM